MDYDPSEPDPPTIPDQRGKRLVRDVSWSSKVRFFLFPSLIRSKARAFSGTGTCDDEHSLGEPPAKLGRETRVERLVEIVSGARGLGREAQFGERGTSFSTTAPSLRCCRAVCIICFYRVKSLLYVQDEIVLAGRKKHWHMEN
jgi:hypothetical protein